MNEFFANRDKGLLNKLKKESKNFDNPDQWLYDKMGTIYKTSSTDDSNVYKDYENKISIQIDRQINPPQVKEGQYQCKMCKSKKTLFYQLQTRSADEPMTTFITCCQCKNKWRE